MDFDCVREGVVKSRGTSQVQRGLQQKLARTGNPFGLDSATNPTYPPFFATSSNVRVLVALK